MDCMTGHDSNAYMYVRHIAMKTIMLEYCKYWSDSYICLNGRSSQVLQIIETKLDGRMCTGLSSYIYCA